MSNPLFEQLGGQMPNNNIMQIINEIQNFQKTFKGNPEEEVKKLLNSGQISQQQFNEFAQIANQLMAFMPK